MLGELDGIVALDLFAGTGALGIEALSRGAERVVFVERDAAAIQALRANLGQLGLVAPEAEIRVGDALAALRAARRAGETYDLVFVDPPYTQARELGGGLSALLPALLAPGARVVVESDRRSPAELSLEVAQQKRYGDTTITIHRHQSTVTSQRTMMSVDKSIAVCPGSYDPITNGHLDVIRRAAELYDEVVVAVVNRSVRKEKTLFGIDERMAFIEGALGDLPRVRAEPFNTLVVDFARRVGAKTIVKGLRAISDFEYEFEMNQLNRRQDPEIESVYLMASPQYSFLSSSGVKELATFGGRIDDLVPQQVAERLQEELRR
jgi:pantetheine-phosphate adenylyltransferase